MARKKRPKYGVAMANIIITTGNIQKIYDDMKSRVDIASYTSLQQRFKRAESKSGFFYIEHYCFQIIPV